MISYVFINILLLVLVLCLLFFQQNSAWSLRCAFRREFVMLEGFHEIAKGIASEDLETAAGAMMEHFHRMGKELEWQNTHSWSPKHPFRLPELPDYMTLLNKTEP